MRDGHRPQNGYPGWGLTVLGRIPLPSKTFQHTCSTHQHTPTHTNYHSNTLNANVQYTDRERTQPIASDTGGSPHAGPTADNTPSDCQLTTQHLLNTISAHHTLHLRPTHHRRNQPAGNRAGVCEARARLDRVGRAALTPDASSIPELLGLHS